MKKSSLLSLIAILGLTLCLIQSARAQQALHEQLTLPIEVKMLYLKLSKASPNFDMIIQENPAYQENPQRFANQNVMNQQRDMLKKLFEKSSISQKIIAETKMKFTMIDTKTRSAILKDIDIDEPILFRMGPEDVYAVFIRNFSAIKNLSPPYEFDDFPTLSGMADAQSPVKTVLTLQPLAIDPQDYELPSKEKVHVILAKVTQLSIDQNDGSRLVLNKHFDETPPLPIPTPVAPQAAAPDAAATVATPDDDKALPPALNP